MRIVTCQAGAIKSGRHCEILNAGPELRNRFDTYQDNIDFRDISNKGKGGLNRCHALNFGSCMPLAKKWLQGGKVFGRFIWCH